MGYYESKITIEKARLKLDNIIIYQYELTDDIYRLNNDYECIECNKSLSVHKKNDLYYFQHPRSNCILSKLDKEDKELLALNSNYNHSKRHDLYQNNIIKFLETKKYTSIEKEKSFYVDSKVKHRADIYFEAFEKKFVIEIQISPLAFRNIIKRIEFYKSNNIYLLWVVDFYNVDSKQFIKDIMKYGSKQNEIFSFCLTMKKLVVNYKKLSYWKKRNKIWEEWITVPLNLENLHYSSQSMQCLYYDSEKKRKDIYLKNPLLLLSHISYDFDDKLVKKLKYYEKHYNSYNPKFLELIDEIFLTEYRSMFERYEIEGYDIFTFLIKENKIKTLKFLLNYGLMRRERYNPKPISENNRNYFFQQNIKSVQKKLSYYYFLDENKIQNCY